MSTTTDSARQRIRAAFDPALVSKLGSRLAEHLADHLRDRYASTGSVQNWTPPPENVSRAAHALDGFADGDLAARFTQLVATTLASGQNLHDPRYIGHQVPAPIPVAGLFDAVGAVTNQVMAVYEMGPFVTGIETALVERLGQLIGYEPGSFAGVVTHGGSLANLTALLTARNVVLGQSWQRGVGTEQPAPVLVSHGEAHYCVTRAAGILGLGTERVVSIDLDENRRMDPTRLDETLADLRDRRVPIVAVCAAACATPIGAFDDLNAIADVCERHDVWLHVDAAHGGAVLFSERHRSLVDGLERADSVVWDAHKMLFVPALCAFVFYRNREHRYRAFHQEAPYLFDTDTEEMLEYDLGLRTIECTKRAATLGLWGVWSMFGPDLFRDLVDVTFETARILHGQLEAAEDFVPLHTPQANILAFRHIPPALREADPDAVGRFQAELRRRIVRSGEFYVVPTRHAGHAALRITVMNPLTDESHLRGLLDALRNHGRELLAER